MEDVLIESRKEEDFVAFKRAADGTADLLLAVVRFEGEKGIGRAEGTVPQIVEGCAVHVIRTGFCDHVDDRTAGASLLRTVGIRGDAELLHDFRGKRIGRAVASAGLGEEGVVEVESINQKAVLESSDATEGEIAIRGGGQAARILRHAGRK